MVFKRLAAGLLALAAAPVFVSGAKAEGPWSATLYAGPSSTKFVTQILGGDFEVNGGMVGLAVDRGLFKLGSGISFAAEAQVTQFFGTYSYGTGAIGVGFRFDEFPWSDSVRTTFAIYTGPSYAPNAVIIKDPVPHQDPKFLNFVSVEAGVGLYRKTDVVLRIYHRSGAWGLYSNTADVGTMIGIGLRRRF
ncbi:MAG: hypothetical protein JO261_09765 [Alphaproteobacteria bacterium]|nr:hypothetical protein [Alphaproteobacteria bacterium]MBV9693976.1 hypothetical protein [Alphaproteobacteria bacterium]